MAESYHVLGRLRTNPANQWLAAYTVPSGKSAIISSIIVTNTGDGGSPAESFYLAILPAGTALGAITSDMILVGNNILDLYDTMALTEGYSLETGAIIAVYGSINGATVLVFGSEIS